MAFVYRTVPSLASTIKKFGTLKSKQENLEGILYDLGYVSFEDVYPFFRQNEEVTTTFRSLNENCKFFYLFPYDALMHTYSNINGRCYENFKFELLEYNIPNEILLKYCGYGFYNGCAYVEFCIPESEFIKNSSSTIDIGLFANELSKNKELANVAHFENKRAYITDFITRNRNLYDTSELYDEKDFLSFQKIIEQLNQKKVISPSNILEIYEMFQRKSDDVYQNREDEVKKLQRNLKKTLNNFN